VFVDFPFLYLQVVIASPQRDVNLPPLLFLVQRARFLSFFLLPLFFFLGQGRRGCNRTSFCCYRGTSNRAPIPPPRSPAPLGPCRTIPRPIPLRPFFSPPHLRFDPVQPNIPPLPQAEEPRVLFFFPPCSSDCPARDLPFLRALRPVLFFFFCVAQLF